MTEQLQDQTPLNGGERKRGWGMRWNPEINPGHIMQVVTVIGAVIVVISTWSSDKTKVELTLARIETQIGDNQKAITEKVDSVRTDLNEKLATARTDQIKANGDLSGQQKETAATVTQIQRTLDQTMPRMEERVMGLQGSIQELRAKVEEFAKWKTEADGKISGFENFRTRIESASPSSKRGG